MRCIFFIGYVWFRALKTIAMHKTYFIFQLASL